MRRPDEARGIGRLPALLRGVRRRTRLAWALDTVQLAAPLVAVIALVLVALTWIAPWDIGGERLALLIAAGAVLVVVGTAIALRLPDRIVARVADRGMRTKDAFATALEVPPTGTFGAKIRDRAIRLAEGGRPNQAIGLPWRRRPVMLAAALTPAIVALAVIETPQDRERAERERDAAAIDDAIAQVEDAADELADNPESAEAVERLEALAEELAETDERAEADELLRQTAEEMDQSTDPEALAERAATQGLERSVGSEPLPGSEASTPAAEQFEQLGDQLGGLSQAEMAETADRLDDLAATQTAGNPAAAESLADAAEALRAGDTAAAAAALGEAATAQRSASASAASTTAMNEGSTAAEQAADNLSGSGQGERRGSGGTGQGGGQGQGQGQGQGEGQGQGGSGQGSGGGGAPGGNVSGANSDGSGASGQGGQGQATGGDNAENNPDESPELDTIFDPAYGGGGDELTVGGGVGAGEGGTIGTNDGPTNDGASQVDLSETVTDYAEQATSAMDATIIAPTDQQLVTDYFDELQNRE